MSLVLTNVETEQSATVAVWPVSWSFRGLFIADGGVLFTRFSAYGTGGGWPPIELHPITSRLDLPIYVSFVLSLFHVYRVSTNAGLFAWIAWLS